MSEWRRKASELLPELQKVISEADNSMTLWIELLLKFEGAFKDGNDDQVKRILQYARYCLNGRDDYVRTAVACGFLEHLPQNAKMAAAIPKWFTLDEFIGLEKVFEYHAGAEVVAHIRNQYRNKK
jgi:hypothetical protein